MTTTGIPSVPSMCRKGMDFVAYWASSRVPPVLLSAPAVWSTVHQLLCASLIPLTFPPTSVIVVVMGRPAGEPAHSTFLFARPLIAKSYIAARVQFPVMAACSYRQT